MMLIPLEDGLIWSLKCLFSMPAPRLFPPPMTINVAHCSFAVRGGEGRREGGVVECSKSISTQELFYCERSAEELHPSNAGVDQSSRGLHSTLLLRKLLCSR